jgi:hypothetical protein
MAMQVMAVDGEVIAAHSSWTDDGSRIVTEATVRTADGREVVVSQLGGSVDGIGMITMPGPPILEPGMQVAVAAHSDLDLAQREHVVLDSVKVLAYPPGYVRTGPTNSGHFLYWESGCVFVTVDAGGTTAIPGDGAFPVIDASIATWNDGTVSATCSYLKVMNEGRRFIEVGYDKVNVIKFRDTVWGRPATSKDSPRTYSPNLAGITTLTYIDDASTPRDGAIVDGDIEINGVNFDISVNGQTSGPPGACLAELQNTLTHELGHLRGLEHTCVVANDPPRVDDQGNPVPLCTAVLAAPTLPANMKILDATMFNFQDCGETKKETLSSDDIQAICDIYSVARDPKTCDRVGAPGGDAGIGSDAGTGSDAGIGSDAGTGSGPERGCWHCNASGGDRPDATLVFAGVTGLLLMRRRKRPPGA